MKIKLIIFLILLSTPVFSNSKQGIKAINGIFDLTAWSIEKDGLISLEGE